MQFGDKYQCVDKRVDFGAFLLIKRTEIIIKIDNLYTYLFAFQSLHFGCCTSVACVSVASQITARSMGLFFIQSS